MTITIDPRPAAGFSRAVRVAQVAAGVLVLSVAMVLAAMFMALPDEPYLLLDIGLLGTITLFAWGGMRLLMGWPR